jgi:fibro-slime domain-containing protein
MKKTLTALAAVVLSAGLFASAKPAAADTFNIQYFTAPSGSADFYNGGSVPIGVSTNYVTSTLGPNGLPVFNSAFTASSGTVNAPASIYLGASNQLLYWSPTNPKGGHITADGTGTINLSSTPTNMFAPPPSGNGSTDANVEETAILTGFFTVLPGNTDTVTFDVGADDTAFVYVDGSLVESLGGIHGDTVVPSNTVTYGAGTHEIEIFYADRDETQAALSFSDSNDLSITATPTPEPGTFLLFGTGLLGAAGAIRRRFVS